MKRIVSEFSWEGPIVDHSQYWQGRSTVHTTWEEVSVGVGSTPKEAAEDALEMAEQTDWDTSIVSIESTTFPDEDPDGLNAEDVDSDLQYYAVLWMK